MHIIDFHAHIYPEKIALKASKTIGEFYGVPVVWHGLVEELLESGARIGVERYVVHSTATRAEQVVSINDYIIGEAEKEKQFIAFGTMHPDFAGAEREIGRIKKAGVRGIKLHPDFQKFAADAREMDDIYELIAAAGLPVLIHAGDSRFDFSGPRRIAKVLEKHPGLKLVAAHFGGYTEWDEAFDLLAGKNLWFDTSSTFWKLQKNDALKMIAKHGTERFLFGSDFPMWDHAGELERFLSLGLDGRANEAILHGNAASLLDLR